MPVQVDSGKHRIRRGIDPDFAPVYEAAALMRERSLQDLDSLFEPGAEAWSVAAADELTARFIDGADEGDRSFAEKLEDQMAGASPPAIRLMAELMFIHLLPLVNVTLETKRRNIDIIGSWAPTPLETPRAFDTALELGIFNGGAGFNTGRPNHLRFLIRFASKWTRLSVEDRANYLADPWAFKDLLHELPIDGAVSQRNALLLMLFPRHFEDISSRDHKRRIVEAFPKFAGPSADIDRQLLAIREAKSDEFGLDFSWYSEGIRDQWDKKPQPALDTAEPVSAVQTLERLLPTDSARQAFGVAVAKTILVAHEVNPHSWSVSFRSKGLHLNIGPNRIISVRPGSLSLALRGKTNTEISSRLTSASLATADVDEPYSFPGETSLVTVSLEEAETLLSHETDSCLLAAEASAARHTPHWKSHAPHALDAIRELSGVELPDMPDRESAAQPGQQAWIIHVKRDDGTIDAAGSLERGETRVFWKVNVPPNSTLDVIKDALRAENPEMSNHSLGNQAGSVHRFITRAKPGDVVVMPDGSDLYVGTIVGDAEYVLPEAEWVREVEWAADPIERSDVSPALYSRLRSLLTITDVSALLPELLSYLVTEDQTTSVPAGTPAEVRLASIDDDLAQDWMLDREWLTEIVGLIQRKKQVIFYGPPGTGKTYLAERLASHLTTDAGTYKLVQFHPSYSYEDFVEGFRPRASNDGALTYELTPGPLKLLAAAASANPGEPYFLIIDEINRGNLAKIFGELYYLLEYRERSLILQYGSADEDEFALPENLYVIGTMNTADRSIAMVDAAIRRRFNFVEFSPTQPPISGLLRKWLAPKGAGDEPARLLEELNVRLDDADYAIGPSYLMNEDALDDEGLRRIWKYSIMPLLTEHFYGKRGATDRFELDELRRAVVPVPMDSRTPDLASASSPDETAAEAP